MLSQGRLRARLQIGGALGVLLAVAACGGGGGGSVISAPAPAPTPTPTPVPTPTPTPTPVSTGTFDTAEFRRSDGPEFHRAVTAWSQNATGSGVKIAIVDTGIDTDSPEFRGRIDPASSDVAGNGTVEAFDDHGTQVALVAAAARDNTGVMGIAYNATIVAFRADRPGSCASASGSDTDGCVFSDRDIATGIDRAVAAGATVINLSLGGDPPAPILTSAVQRATAAGAVIVVSAGNGGDGSEAGIDPNQPDPFASAVRNAGGANVIIVGSVNDAGQISAFSNRAGSQASFYLTALGERVCCAYENGVLKVETTPSGNFVTVVSGTSFSAPQVAGAVALLKQAFPTLTGAQMVSLLLETAREAGAAGTDSTYGRGILDIGAAFAPRGTTTLAGTTSVIARQDDTAIGSAAMGDALSMASAGTVILDTYGRAYGTDLGRRMQSTGQAPRLYGALDSRSQRVGGGGAGLSMAFTLSDSTAMAGAWPSQLRLTRHEAEAASVLAARVAIKLAPGQQLGFTFREHADGLAAQMQGHARPAFLIAGDARGDTGFLNSSTAALVYRREFGTWGLTASTERGEALLGALRITDGSLDRHREALGLSSFGLAADRRFGNLEAALGLTWLREDRTMLGGYFVDGFGAGGANTVFADASAGWNLAKDLRLGGAFRQGWTRPDRSAVIGAGSAFVSRAWLADLVRQGVLGRFDRLGFRVSQPLRVEQGGLSLFLPVAYDYATLSPTFGLRAIDLSPTGRELDGEIAWAGPLWGGDAAASLFYRKDPGHLATLPDDKGVALKWSKRF